MKVTILGAGCGIPSTEFSSPGILLQVAEEPFVFDLGSGALIRLLKAGVNYVDLSYIFLTHFHSDHASDVAPLIQALWTTPFFHRSEPLTIFGPENLDDFMRSLAAAFGDWVYEPEFPLELVPVKKSSFSVSSLKVKTLPMSHRQKKAVGYRVEDETGKSVVYSGDTDVCDEIIELADHANLLILECSFPGERKMEGHLVPEEAAQIAAQANCKHLVLTHFCPPYEELFNEIRAIVPKIFGGKLSLAQDLMTFLV